MKKTLLVLFVLSAVIACKKPEACFDASTTSPKLGQPVSFTDCSQKAEHYHWDFGDNTSSTETSPSHTYEVPGAYTVTLKVDNKKKKKEHSITQSITVAAPTKAEITGTWENYKSVDADGDETTIDPPIDWTFRSDDTLTIENDILSFEWSVSADASIDLGSFQIFSTFAIVKFYDDEMVIREKEPFFGAMVADNYYRKK